GVYFLSYAQILDFRHQADTFSDIFASDVALAGMSANGTADHFLGSFVTGNYFSALRVKPALGRLFQPGEGEQPGSGVLIVLGYSYWQKRFAGNSEVVGKEVLVDGRPATIIGVAPQEFRGTSFGLNFDVYLPMNLAAAQDPNLWTDRDDRRWAVFGRLKNHTSLHQARSQITLIMARLAGQYPATDKRIQVRVLSERMARPVPLANNLVHRVVGLFLALAMIVLLLACANVATILMLRAISKEHEIAIRSAMGASRSRLIRQILLESTLLALLGMLGGMVLGMWVVGRIADFGSASALPVALDLGLDWRVFAYALSAACLSSLMVGLWPAVRVSRANLNQTLREGCRKSSGATRHRWRSALVTAQIAASLVLLIVAGLFARSLRSVERIYLGFEPDHLLNVMLDPREIGYDQVRTVSFYQDLEHRVRALPGVASVSFAFVVPMGTYLSGDGVTIETHPTPGQPPPLVMDNLIDPGYFETMKIRLLRGRSFTQFDSQEAPRVAIVNRTMASHFWPTEDALGKRFQAKGSWWQVVGIAEDGKYGVAWEDARPFFYLPLKQSFMSMRVLEIRTSGAPEELIAPIKQVIATLDPALPIFSLQTMSQSLAGVNGFMVFRVGAQLASSIGVAGLVLSIIGVYGVVAFAATARTREIGIRIALGATRGEVLRLVLGQGLWVIVGGCALGLLA
ncbi:MAG: ABC transporter permease, partial [Deltaproteobacteria bacterium]|nr:ABC transporter permease [Deltaproteobacteria bacterium]